MSLIKRFKDYLTNEAAADTDESQYEAEAVVENPKARKTKAPKVVKEKKNKAAKKTRESKKNIQSEDFMVKQGKSGASSGDERSAAEDFCEQLIDVAYHIEDANREYKLVTDYLVDIQRIEELPIEIATDIVNTASRIEMLEGTRQMYSQSESLLTQEQFQNISSFETEAPSIIKKFYELEQRDTMLKEDMSHLEAEKQDLRYMRRERSKGIKSIRSIIATMLVIFFIITTILLGVAVKNKTNVTVYALAIGVLVLLTFVICLVKYRELVEDIALSDAKVNRAISLLNKVKVKMINNTNTLDYMYEKYKVNSCRELEYQWEQYDIMVKDAMKRSQASSDIRVCYDELVAILSRVGVKDPLVWERQTRALIDRKEMVEIKHSLNARRQRIREQIKTLTNIRNNAMIALRALIEINPALETYISELLSSYSIKLE